jgi:hypothetical protein
MRDPIPAVTVETFANNLVNYEIKFWYLICRKSVLYGMT